MTHPTPLSTAGSADGFAADLKLLLTGAVLSTMNSLADLRDYTDKIVELHEKHASPASDLVKALEAAEAAMSIVEPRSDKRKYLEVLDIVRSALTRHRQGEKK